MTLKTNKGILYFIDCGVHKHFKNTLLTSANNKQQNYRTQLSGHYIFVNKRFN